MDEKIVQKKKKPTQTKPPPPKNPEEKFRCSRFPLDKPAAFEHCLEHSTLLPAWSPSRGWWHPNAPRGEGLCSAGYGAQRYGHGTARHEQAPEDRCLCCVITWLRNVPGNAEL